MPLHLAIFAEVVIEHCHYNFVVGLKQLFNLIVFFAIQNFVHLTNSFV